jgi:hypothetical protein
VKTKHFDGDQSIAGAIMRAKNRTKCACADLMENPKRPECLWRKVQDGIFAGQ